jgi:hypothetical protein
VHDAAIVACNVFRAPFGNPLLNGCLWGKMYIQNPLQNGCLWGKMYIQNPLHDGTSRVGLTMKGVVQHSHGASQD